MKRPDAHIERLAADLRASLSAVLHAVAGPEPRPSAVGRILSLDKSLASRLVRSVSAGSDLEFLHYVPSPTGLNILLEAAQEAGADPGLLEGFAAEVVRFRGLLSTLPGGRADLEAVVSDGASQVRARSMRSASQTIFRGASALLGYECSSLASSLLVVPSEHPKFLDAIEIQHRIAIRRLRPTAAIGLLRVVMTASSWEEGEGMSFVTIDGAPIERPEDVILTGASDRELPKFEVVGDGEEVTLILAEEQTALREPVTLTTAIRMRRAFARYQRDEAPEGCRTYRIHIPCRRVVRSVFFHEDCHSGPPDFTFELPRPGTDIGAREEGLLGRVGSIDIEAPVNRLGTGLRDTGIRGIPRCREALRDVFERVGWDPRQFHGYTTDVAYPVPFVYMRCWLPLAKRP